MKNTASIPIIFIIGCFLMSHAVQAGWLSSSVSKAVVKRTAVNTTERRAAFAANKSLAEKTAVRAEEERLAYMNAKRSFQKNKISEKTFNKAVEKFDHHRDMNLQVKPIERSRTVSRYTSLKQAKIGQVNGLTPTPT